jgi:hypothetical protein
MRTKHVKTMAKLAHTSLLALVVLGVLSCADDRTNSDGNVVLSFGEFDGLPAEVSVNDPQGTGFASCSLTSTAGCFVTIDSIIVRSIVTGGVATSDLMTVELRSYEVRFRRRAPGTRQIPNHVGSIFGPVAPGGTNDINNLRILDSTQLLNVPLSDLLISEGGVDRETGRPEIVVDAELFFFGRTVSGIEVATEDPARFTLRFTL